MWRTLCIYAGFPQVWVFIIIFVLAITMFAFSFQAKSDYWASLCSNIFAGLVTGLVLSLLSGVRQIYVSIQQKKIDWLQQLHQMILDYYSIKHDFMSGNYRGQDKEDFIYDMGAHLSWIKDSIVQASFDRRLPFNATKYCKKHMVLMFLRLQKRASLCETRFVPVIIVIRTVFGHYSRILIKRFLI